MKLFVVCALVLVIIENVNCSMSPAQVESAKKLMRNVCQPKSKVSGAVVDNMRKGQFVPERELMCYMECCLRTGQIMKDAKLNMDSARTQIGGLPPDMATAALASFDACEPVVKSADKCEAAYEFYKCFYEHDPEHFFLP